MKIGPPLIGKLVSCVQGCCQISRYHHHVASQPGRRRLTQIDHKSVHRLAGSGMEGVADSQQSRSGGDFVGPRRISGETQQLGSPPLPPETLMSSQPPATIFEIRSHLRVGIAGSTLSLLRNEAGRQGPLFDQPHDCRHEIGIQLFVPCHQSGGQKRRQRLEVVLCLLTVLLDRADRMPHLQPRIPQRIQDFPHKRLRIGTTMQEHHVDVRVDALFASSISSESHDCGVCNKSVGEFTQRCVELPGERICQVRPAVSPSFCTESVAEFDVRSESGSRQVDSNVGG